MFDPRRKEDLAREDLEPAKHDRRDPDPWLALDLDRSLPLDEDAKRALARGNDSYARRTLLPASRPVIFLFFVLVHLLRRVFPRRPQLPGALHRLIYWGLKTFASPEANLLILRHFHIGTEILAFIADNVPGVEIQAHPLRPQGLQDLKDNLFLQHDLNIYNFIIELNQGLRAQGRELEAPARITFDAISDEPFALGPLPDRWHNFMDVQTAVEFYTPLYALFLSRHDFVRAANSLQLDETIAIYIGQILGDQSAMSLVNNRHPLVPLSTFQAGYRLMMHGLDAEVLHGYLRRMKQQQKA